MSAWNLIKRFAAGFLYLVGLIGAMTTAFGVTQAIFSDKLLDVVILDGNPCNPGEDTLSRWERSVSSNVGRFVYLDVNIGEIVEACEGASIGEYPFMTRSDGNSLNYVIPLAQPIAANYMSRLLIPVSDAAESLLANGFLDFYNEGILRGNGVFFVDLMDNPHSGPFYRLVPAPYSVETNQMQNCTSSVFDASGILAQTRTFIEQCIIYF